MRTKVSISLALGLFLAGVSLAAEAPGEPPTSVERPACPAPGSMTLASLGIGDSVPTAGGQVVFGATSCCFSDPCPATGEPVSCCEEGCSAWSDRVWCSSTGFIYCPEEDPCEQDGQCNTSCGCDDSDCATCDQGRSCAADSDCDPCGLGFGFCDKETWERVGTCSCHF